MTPRQLEVMEIIERGGQPTRTRDHSVLNHLRKAGLVEGGFVLSTEGRRTLESHRAPKESAVAAITDQRMIHYHCHNKEHTEGPYASVTAVVSRLRVLRSDPKVSGLRVDPPLQQDPGFQRELELIFMELQIIEADEPIGYLVKVVDLEFGEERLWGPMRSRDTALARRQRIHKELDADHDNMSVTVVPVWKGD